MTLYAIDATLAGNSGISPDAAGTFLLGATFAGDSGLTAGEIRKYPISCLFLGVSNMNALETWIGAHRTPNNLPQINSAASLQQFIDSLGSSRSASRVPSRASLAVERNPPKKPFVPR